MNLEKEGTGTSQVQENILVIIYNQIVFNTDNEETGTGVHLLGIFHVKSAKHSYKKDSIVE